MTKRAAYGGGSMTERSGHPGIWRLRWREDGRLRETTFRGSKAAAAAELRERVRLAGGSASAEVERAAAKESGRTVGDALDAWLHHIDGDRAQRYVEESRAAVERRIRPAIGRILLDRLTVKDLDAMLSGWAREGLTGSSLVRYFAPVSAALKLARKRGEVTENVAEMVSMPRGKASRMKVTPTAAEVAELIRAAETNGDDEMVAALWLAYTTGARRGELAALRWADVDLDAGTVHIGASIDRRGRTGSTKTRKARTVALDPATVELLRLRQGDADETESVIGLNVDKITDRMRKLVARCAEAGAVRAGITFHDGRHAAASELLAAGVALPAVSARLGHSSPRTTLAVYAHAVRGADRAAAVIMGELLTGAGA